MQFNLNYTPPKASFDITHRDQLFLIGSCFSENIGSILYENKFNTLNNPEGILFNPLSIYNSLKNCLQKNNFEDKYILEKGGEYFSYLHHSSVKDLKKDYLIEKINKNTSSTFEFIKNCNILIITFGTAYYYKHLALGSGVANCHKQPGSFFEKKLLPVNNIVNQYSSLVDALSKLNPKLKIIFTVSPVKYLKDGVIENNVSKATLLLSIHELVEQNQNCFYFPAYELVTDDLRDYRFYKEDLAHPNDLAIKYVWQKFSESFFNTETKLLNEKIGKLNIAKKHKRLHAHTEENSKLEKHIADLVSEIKKINPSIDL